MNANMIRIAKPVLVAATLATIFWVSAGDLNPPPGAIAATQRTPIGANTTFGDADSLFRIASPGSYYLTGNITIAAGSGKIGIEIAASGVTLDLMGFDLVGAAGSLDGVRASIAATTDIAVVNGSVRNWAQDGVDLSNASNTRLADLRISGNASNGIFAGANAVLTNCSVASNSYGIFATRSTITNCSAASNTLVGIHTSGGSTITNCSATSNTGIGISANGESTITDCSARNNMNFGIIAGTGSTVTNCSAVGNTGIGIRGSNGSTIINCSAYGNTGDGIQVSDDCTVRANACHSNGPVEYDGAGIHAIGTDNRIEGNNCTNNDRGIDVDSGGNFIARNTCSGNTNNWDVVAGNVILVVNAFTAAAVNGDSGGGAPGSTDPNANFSY